MIAASLSASMSPGMKPAKNSSTIELSVTIPNRISVMLGGIRMAMPPPQAIIPVAIQTG